MKLLFKKCKNVKTCSSVMLSVPLVKSLNPYLLKKQIKHLGLLRSATRDGCFLGLLKDLHCPGLLEVESGPALKTEDGRLEADLLEVKLRGLPATWAWWACRALTAQQRVLSGLSASIRNALHSLTPHVSGVTSLACS